MSDRYPDYWDVTLEWVPRPGEQGAYAEAGAHVSVDECPTAERAVALVREWRRVDPGIELHAISVRRREGGRRP